MPALAELEVFFLAVRAQVDHLLRTAAPIKNGKPYPLGQCLEISLAVEQRLRQLRILLRAGIAPGCARQRQGLQVTVVQFDQALRGGADKTRVVAPKRA